MRVLGDVKVQICSFNNTIMQSPLLFWCVKNVEMLYAIIRIAPNANGMKIGFLFIKILPLYVFKMAANGGRHL